MEDESRAPREEEFPPYAIWHFQTYRTTWQIARKVPSGELEHFRKKTRADAHLLALLDQNGKPIPASLDMVGRFIDLAVAHARLTTPKTLNQLFPPQPVAA